MNEHLRRALEALEAGAADVRRRPGAPLSELRDRLRSTADQILTHLEAEEEEVGDPTNIMARLDRQARDIADDLRRVDDLMKRRHGRE